LFGQIIKEKVRFFQLQWHKQPELVTMNASELDKRAKEHEIHHTAPFLQSRLFTVNDYTLNGDVIEKRFKQQN